MKITARSAWGARSPRNRYTTTWAKRTEFVVHYSEGPTTQSVKNIQDFHMGTRGWSDIAYNFLVDKNGKVYEGRGWLVVGAHAGGHNTSGIGVCFIGRNGDATPAALEAIRELYDDACRRAGRTLAKRGHGQLSGNSTDCPGKQLMAWVKGGMQVPGETDSGSKTGIPDGAPPLRVGSSGTEVERLQDSLNKALGLRLTKDGDFGEATRTAVVQLQKKARIVSDGIYGPASAKALTALLEANK